MSNTDASEKTRKYSTGFTTAVILAMVFVAMIVWQTQSVGTFGACTGIWIGNTGQMQIAVYYDKTPNMRNLCFCVYRTKSTKPIVGYEICNFRK